MCIGNHMIARAFNGIPGCFNKLRPKCSLNTAYVCCIAEKRIFVLVSPQPGVLWRRFFTSEFPGAAIFKCDVLWLQCQAPLLSNTMLDNEKGPGTATITRHISRWRRREIQKWKIAFKKPRFVDLQDQRFVFMLCNTSNLCSNSILGATCWNSRGSL